MNTKLTNNGLENTSQKNTFGSACLGACKEVLARIKDAKEYLLAEARGTLEVQEQLLRLALNEAEALALQTLYPQLVFAELAAEKIQRVAAWSKRQQVLA